MQPISLVFACLVSAAHGRIVSTTSETLQGSTSEPHSAFIHNHQLHKQASKVRGGNSLKAFATLLRSFNNPALAWQPVHYRPGPSAISLSGMPWASGVSRCQWTPARLAVASMQSNDGSISEVPEPPPDNTGIIQVDRLLEDLQPDLVRKIGPARAPAHQGISRRATTSAALAVANHLLLRGAQAANPPAYGDGPEYWNDRYRKDPNPFEWVIANPYYNDTSYRELRGILDEYSNGLKNARILHVGCGTSSLPEKLYDDGYVNIANIDNSDVAISVMRERNKKRPEMTWSVMDVTSMSYKQDSFDIVVELSLIDALACNPEFETIIGRYINEVLRVLRPGGVFISISFSPEQNERFSSYGMAPKFRELSEGYVSIVEK